MFKEEEKNNIVSVTDQSDGSLRLTFSVWFWVRYWLPSIKGEEITTIMGLLLPKCLAYEKILDDKQVQTFVYLLGYIFCFLPGILCFH